MLDTLGVMLDTLSNINILDGIIIVILFIVAGLSYYRGFIHELLSTGAWIGAALITLFFVNNVALFLLPAFKDGFSATIFATMSTYVMALLILSAINTAFIKKYIRPGEDIGKLDNVFGIGLGVVKGWLIITLGFLLLPLIYGQEANAYPDWVREATILPAVEKSAALLTNGLPEHIRFPTAQLAQEQ